MNSVLCCVWAHLFAWPGRGLKVGEFKTLSVFDETFEDSAGGCLTAQILPLATTHAEETRLDADNESIFRCLAFVVIDET